MKEKENQKQCPALEFIRLGNRHQIRTACELCPHPKEEIFVVIEYMEYDCGIEVCGAFSTKEKAQAWIDEYHGPRSRYPFEIIPFKINDLLSVPPKKIKNKQAVLRNYFFSYAISQAK